MSQSFTKLWIHAIWATKHRQDLIDFSIEKKLYDCIWQELTELGCPVRIINGMPDHVHVLFLQNPQKNYLRHSKANKRKFFSFYK
jgi:REP element-mobilizing transposase RayT